MNSFYTVFAYLTIDDMYPGVQRYLRTHVWISPIHAAVLRHETRVGVKPDSPQPVMSEGGRVPSGLYAPLRQWEQADGKSNLHMDAEASA